MAELVALRDAAEARRLEKLEEAKAALLEEFKEKAAALGVSVGAVKSLQVFRLEGEESSGRTRRDRGKNEGRGAKQAHNACDCDLEMVLLRSLNGWQLGASPDKRQSAASADPGKKHDTCQWTGPCGFEAQEFSVIWSHHGTGWRADDRARA